MQAIRLITVVLVLMLTVHSAFAEVKTEGYLIANEQLCPAYQSFRNQTNPQNIRLQADMAYPVVAKNRFDATHYRIEVKGAEPELRWVSVGCGTFLGNCEASQSSSSVAVVPEPGVEGGSYLLALSWQPAFCQAHQSKNECQSQHAQRYDATHFTLHGLWPQPKSNIYCNVVSSEKKLDQRGAWDQLPPLNLPEATYSELIEIMPGVASYLQRHEWIKHGTCYSADANEYYTEAMMLALHVNNSVVRDLFATNIGKRLTGTQIRERFDEAFGEGAGNKVSVRCNDGMISELWINLAGEINEASEMAALLGAAPAASEGCQGGMVDAVGF